MWLKTAVSAVTGLFTGPKSNEEAITKATNGIVDGIDKLFYTQEEKSEQNQKAMELIFEFQKMYVNENTAQSKARRILAFTLTVYFLGCLSLYLFLSSLGIDTTAVKEVVSTLSTTFTAIMLTYFVPHQLTKIIPPKK